MARPAAGDPEGHEASHPRHPGEGGSEISGSRAVPPEPQVTGGAVELREVWGNRRVGHHGSGAVGSLEHAPDGGVEDGPVPRRSLLPHQRRGGLGGELPLERLVVDTPDRDGGVMAEQIDHLAGLTLRLRAHTARHDAA